MEIALAYEKLFAALSRVLSSTRPLQPRLAELVSIVEELEREHVGDEQLRHRFGKFISGAKKAVESEERIARASEDELALYLQDALSIFAAMAIMYREEETVN